MKEKLEMKNIDLAKKLVCTETEKDLISVLKEAGYWDNYAYWQPYGNNENNYSIIGNQQSNADAALVEKLINSVDAVLMKECMIHGKSVSGPDAPQSMQAALSEFFHMRNGQLMNLDTKSRNELSKNIILAATGKAHGEENLTIVDRGEGQTPKKMPQTILSLSKSNKLKVPFVQGKFNMGGTGAFPFCGKHHLQLVISRRCPDIPNTDNDPTFDEWSVTVVRKEEAREGRKSSMYTYLACSDGSLLTFKAETMPIIPTVAGVDKYEEMVYGTFIKLYNYELSGYKTNILFGLNYRLSLLIPDLAHPIRLRECRPTYSGHTLEATLNGMVTRLYDDREDNIEDNFPSSGSINVDGQEMPFSIYLFKKNKQSNYRKKDGIVYIMNGQTQGIENDNFFNRVNLSYIKSSLLVLVDCSKFDINHQEAMFMTSRDRIRTSDFSKKIETQLEKVLRDNQGLKKAEHDRRTAALKDKVADNKPLKNVLENILHKSPVLSKLFIAGTTIRSPFANEQAATVADTFKGKNHPTFFRLKGKLKDGKLNKHAPINHDCRVQFETDVQNDYFNRPIDSGGLILCMDGVERQDLKGPLNLYNGIATLTIRMPVGVSVGDTHTFMTKIKDDCVVNDFENTIILAVEEAQEYDSSGGQGARTFSKNTGKKDTQNNGGIALPEIIPIRKDEWDEYDMNQYSALKYVPTEEGGDYYLNMDNTYFLTELNSVRDSAKSELTKARYSTSMALIGMSVIGYYKGSKKPEDKDVDVQNAVSTVSTMLSPVLIPMLEAMADLTLNDTT
jgi:hypothetical protein